MRSVRNLILAVILCAGVASAVPAVVTAGTTANQNAGTAASVATTGVLHNAGNLLVVYVGFAEGCAGTITVTNTAGDTWTQVGSNRDNTGILCSAMFYAKNVAGNASDVATVTFNVARFHPSISVTEISGCDTTSPLDTSAVGSTNTTTATTGTFTTTSANAILVAGARVYYSGSPSWNGATIAGTSSIAMDTYDTFTAMASLVVSSIQTGQTATMTEGSGGQYISVHVAAFKAATVVPVTPARRSFIL